MSSKILLRQSNQIGKSLHTIFSLICFKITRCVTIPWYYMILIAQPHTRNLIYYIWWERLLIRIIEIISTCPGLIMLLPNLIIQLGVKAVETSLLDLEAINPISYVSCLSYNNTYFLVSCLTTQWYLSS